MSNTIRVDQDTFDRHRAMADQMRLDAWRGTFEKTDRILTGKPIVVSIADSDGGPEAPAWSDGQDIFLHRDKALAMMKANDPVSAVLRLKGLNYHELSHVLYTPRMNTEFMKAVMQRHTQWTGGPPWFYALNALEDQRIETWFASTYGPSRRYFEATVLEWIVKEGDASSLALIYGRKYLSAKVRVQAGAVFRKQYGSDLHHRFMDVIDEYITVDPLTNKVKAMSLLSTYRDLLAELSAARNGAALPVLIIADNGGDSAHQAHAPKGGRVILRDAKDAQSRAQAAVKQAKADDAQVPDKAQGGDDAGDDGKDGADGTDTGSSDQQSDAGDQSGSGGGDPADSGSTGNDGSAGAGGAGDQSAPLDDAGDDARGSDPDAVTGDDWSDLADAANDAMDDVRDDDAVQNDVDQITKAVRSVVNQGLSKAEGDRFKRSSNGFSPKEADRLAVRRVKQALTRIRQEAEPETLRRQVAGRLDARRAMTRRPNDVEVFKTYDAGTEEETGIEAVVLLDISGSMTHMSSEASAAMWTLKRAFDLLDIPTTVLLYNTSHVVLYQPREKSQAGKVVNCASSGGTNPLSALEQARNILVRSQQANRVLVTITDGQWGCNDSDVKPLMKDMHQKGTHSLMLGLAGAAGTYGLHHHQAGGDVSRPADIPKVVNKLVARIMQAAQV